MLAINHEKELKKRRQQELKKIANIKLENRESFDTIIQEVCPDFYDHYNLVDASLKYLYFSHRGQEYEIQLNLEDRKSFFKNLKNFLKKDSDREHPLFDWEDKRFCQIICY